MVSRPTGVVPALAFLGLTSCAGYDMGVFVVNADGSGRRKMASNAWGNPVWSPGGKRITFVSRDAELRVAMADSPRQEALASRSSRRDVPSWSPDGGRMAFASRRAGRAGIHVANADGSGRVRLTKSIWDSDPFWSPDGKRLAFVSFEKGWHELYVIDADGSHAERLARILAPMRRPWWSPDGTRLTFLSGRDDKEVVYAINADGSGLRRLTDSRAGDRSPRLSPAGDKIALISFREGKRGVYVMNSDGSGLRRLPIERVPEGRMLWSPDGKRIAVCSPRRILVASTEGPAQIQIPRRAPFSHAASWSPDGGRIAFVSGRGARSEIYVADVDDSVRRRLTRNTVPEGPPSWAPAGTSIAFRSAEESADYGWDGYLYFASAVGAKSVGLGVCRVVPWPKGDYLLGVELSAVATPWEPWAENDYYDWGNESELMVVGGIRLARRLFFSGQAGLSGQVVRGGPLDLYVWDARAFFACSAQLMYLDKHVLISFGYHNRRGPVFGIGFAM